MDKNYYVEYYNLEREHWWFKARLEIIRSHVASILPKKEGLKILNIGVATGATTTMLQEFGEVKSVEYDKECFAFVKERLKIDIDNESITALPYADRSYDLVCAFDVIEHVEQDDVAVAEMKRVCKDSGSVMVTVPAFMSIWSKHDEVNHHFRRYKKQQLKNLFSSSGKISFASYFNFYLFPPIYLFRKISNLFPVKRSGAGSDFGVGGQGAFNGVFYNLLKSENLLLKRRVALPFGVSILLSWKKTS